MGYQPNVVNKGDFVEINGIPFVVKKDFNKQKHTRLILIPIEYNNPQYFKAKLNKQN